MEKHNSNTGLLAAASVIAGGVLGLLSYLDKPESWIFGLLLLLLFALTLLAQDTEGDAEKISGVITEKDNLRLYSYLTGKILAYLARVMAPNTAQKQPPPKGVWAKMVWYTTPRAADVTDLNRLRASPWSWPVMDAALRLAIIYPLFLLLAQWALTGSDTGFGGATVLVAEPRDWLRYATIGVVSAYLLSVTLATAMRQRVYESVAAWLVWIVVAVVVAFAVAVAVAVVVAGAVAVVVAGAVAVGYACQKQKGGIAYGLLVLVLGAGLVAVFAATSPL